VLGLYCSPGDDHIGEYIGYAWEIMGMKGYNFAGAREYRDTLKATIERLLTDDDYVREYARGRSGEIAFNIIGGMLADSSEILAAVNIVNNGCISNLPDDAIVEVPAAVGARGLTGLCVGDLPEGIAALCNTQIGVQKLVVEAAVTGSRQIALQAMLADPVVQSAEAGEKCLDELLAVHKAYLPRFG
jgi:alpha-galactosidase